MESLLVDDLEMARAHGSRILLKPTRLKTGIVFSGSSLELIVKSIAVLNVILGLLLLLGNIMLLLLLVSYPLHEFNMIQIAVLKEDPEHNVFHLANLSKKQLIWMLTLTSLYFMMELMIGKVLYFGAHKRSRSKCQLWVDIHRIVWIMFFLSFVYNMFDMEDSTAAVLVYSLCPTVIWLGASIYLVNAFIKDIEYNQDFSYATIRSGRV